jgi:hypothetical protein
VWAGVLTVERRRATPQYIYVIREGETLRTVHGENRVLYTAHLSQQMSQRDWSDPLRDARRLWWAEVDTVSCRLTRLR